MFGDRGQGQGMGPRSFEITWSDSDCYWGFHICCRHYRDCRVQVRSAPSYLSAGKAGCSSVGSVGPEVSLFDMYTNLLYVLEFLDRYCRMQLWNIGARFVDSKKPTFPKIVKICLTQGLGIRNHDFCEKASGWCGRLMCEKMRALWNNVTSKYRERIKPIGGWYRTLLLACNERSYRF